MKVDLTIYELSRLSRLCVGAMYDETAKADGSDKFFAKLHDKLRAEIDNYNKKQAEAEEQKELKKSLTYK